MIYKHSKDLLKKIYGLLSKVIKFRAYNFPENIFIKVPTKGRLYKINRGRTVYHLVRKATIPI